MKEGKNTDTTTYNHPPKLLRQLPCLLDREALDRVRVLRQLVGHNSDRDTQQVRRDEQETGEGGHGGDLAGRCGWRNSDSITGPAAP